MTVETLNIDAARLRDHRSRLVELREIVLANAVMCGEIPSPTFGEEDLVRFVTDRFTESALQNICTDEVNNATAVLPGTTGEANILVVAHLDRIWQPSVDHTVTVGSRTVTGPGIADNSLGVAGVVSLPFILERLDLKLRSNLVLLGTTRSMGRGDLEGIRFFLRNTKVPIHGGVCVEGIQLGRLSYSCLGMTRAEIDIRTPEVSDFEKRGSSGAVVVLNRLIDRILAIETPSQPRTTIVLGSVNAGSAFNVPPTEASLRLEVRSEQPGMVSRITQQLQDLVAQINAEENATASMSILARRKPGSLDFTHPLVSAARAIMSVLEVPPRIAPSTSELSALLDQDIPALTLGLTYGDHKNALDETVKIEPLFDGLTQLVAVLEALDSFLNDE